MNKTYRNVWNAATNTWGAASELAKGRKKSSKSAVTLAVVALLALPASAVFAADDAEEDNSFEPNIVVLDAAGAIRTMGVMSSGTAVTSGPGDYVAGGGSIDGNVTGGNNTAIGANSVITRGGYTGDVTNSVAIGGATVNNGGGAAPISGTIGIGAGATAWGSGTIAIGRGASNNNNNAVAIGTNSYSGGGTGTVALGTNASTTASGAVAIGMYSRTTGANSASLGANTGTSRVNAFSVGNDITTANADGSARTAFTRQIVNVTAGTADNDAVNVAQMNAGLSTTNAAIAATNLNVSSLSTGLSTTSSTVAGLSTGLSSTNSTVAGLSTGLSSTKSTVAGLSTGLSTTNSTVAGLSTGLSSTTSTVAGHTKQIGDLDDKLSKLESGTSGLVQQANPGDDITVGANTGGNAVNFTGTAGARTLTGVAAGDISAASTDAVNGAQLHGVSDSVASAIGGGSTVNPDGSISAPSFTVGDGSGGTKIVNSVGDVVTNLDGRVTTNEGDIKKLADDIGSGTLGLVQQATPNDDITVGANTGGNAVNFSSKTGARKLTGVAAGDVSDASTDAVNGSQLHGVADSVASAIGGGSTVNPDGSISAPSFTVGDGSGGTKIVNSVGDVVTNLDGRVTTNEGDIKKLADDIGSGTLGLVQQATPNDDITVGANTGGNAVNFSSKTGARKLTGVAAGDVSVASTDAVNGSQLHGVAGSVASAIGGGSTVNLDGSISAPSFTVGDGSGGTKIVNSVGDAVTNLDGRTTANEGDIKKLASDIGSGTLGLVQQTSPGGDITVGANTGGAAVDFGGTAGTRKLTGIANGSVTAGSTDAVTGDQLHATNQDVAKNASDLASLGTQVTSIDGRVTSIDGRVTSNETSITQIRNDMSSGSIGLVRQDPSSGAITVAAASGGASVNFAGTGGARTLSGIANGVNNDDAVTIAQLKATGLIDYTGKEIGAVTYDDGIELDSVTFGGKSGTTLHNIAPGLIAAGSMDGVNGGQLYAMQQEFAKQYGDLNNRVGDLSGRIGELEAGAGGPGDGGGTPGYGPGTGTGGEGSLVVGGGADASGSNGTAIGQGAGASGSNGTALGQGSVASGSNGTALGQGAIASGENSTALGQGASATGSGSVAIGQGSVATEANTVSFGNGTEEGNRRLVNIADGINASDAATKGQLDRAMESVDARFNDTNRAINDVAKNAYAGIAAAMAMPNMTPSQPGKTVVAVGAANFKSGSAIAAGATYRSRSGNWLVNGATSITSVGDVGVRAQVGYEF